MRKGIVRQVLVGTILQCGTSRKTENFHMYLLSRVNAQSADSYCLQIGCMKSKGFRKYKYAVMYQKHVGSTSSRHFFVYSYPEMPRKQKIDQGKFKKSGACNCTSERNHSNFGHLSIISIKNNYFFTKCLWMKTAVHACSDDIKKAYVSLQFSGKLRKH